MRVRGAWFALCISTTLVSGCAYVDLANFLPAASRIDRAFGQLYERGGIRQISHYVVVTVPEAPAGTFSLRTLSTGTIEYIAEVSPGSDEMGNCLILRPKHYLTSSHDFSRFEPLPDEDELVFAYCNLDEASVRAAARALYADPRRLGGASETELDQAANSFIRHDEGFTLLDVESQTDAPTSSDSLGNALSNELYFAAFTEDDSPVRQYVNPIPYLAAAFGSTTHDTVAPTIEEIVVQTSQSGSFGVDAEDHPIVGDSIAVPLPRHFLRVAIVAPERTAPDGQPTVPYAISTHLTWTTGDPRLRSRGRGLLNAFYYTQRAVLVFAAYGTSEGVVSDIGAGRFYQFVPWNKTWPPPEEDDDAFNALAVSENMVLDLNSISDGEEVFPGGAYQLQLTVSDGATSAHSRTIQFQLRGGVTIEVMEDTDNDHIIGFVDTALGSVRIARWDNAYEPGPGFHVRNNGDPDNFVEQDPSRFYLRITDPDANRNAAMRETIRASIGTGGGPSGLPIANDDLTPIELSETGADTGVFVSQSQLLTASNRDDPPLLCEHALDEDCEDDEFWVAGVGDWVADDIEHDRTHRADIDGYLWTEYRPASAATDQRLNSYIPVCQRDPDERRRVEMRITVFNEPFRNVGLDGRSGTHDRGEGNVDAAGLPIFDFDDLDGDGQHDAGEPSEPFMDLSDGQNFYCPRPGPACIPGSRGGVVDAARVSGEVARANIAWAPACLKSVMLGEPTFVDAPVNPATGNDILNNSGLLDHPSDTNVVIREIAPRASVDVVEVFYVALLTGIRRPLGFTMSPVNASADPLVGDNTFVFIGTNLDPRPGYRLTTLQHELGHALDNLNLTTEPLAGNPIFYPTSNTNDDERVNRYRRITSATMEACLTVRAPGGARSDPGNTLLKSY